MNMKHLEKKLELHQDKRTRLIVTDGVFSHGRRPRPAGRDVRPGREVRRHGAGRRVATPSGFIGKTGRGTHEHFGVMDKVDLITTTFGKGLGGASGGCVSGRKEIDRALPPEGAALPVQQLPGAAHRRPRSIKVIDLISRTTERRDKLEWNTEVLPRGDRPRPGCDIRPGDTPIVPVMLYNAKLANDMARDMYAEGIYVIGFFFPVVPAGAGADPRAALGGPREGAHRQGRRRLPKVGEKYGILGLDKKGIIEKYGM